MNMHNTTLTLEGLHRAMLHVKEQIAKDEDDRDMMDALADVIAYQATPGMNTLALGAFVHAVRSTGNGPQACGAPGAQRAGAGAAPSPQPPARTGPPAPEAQVGPVGQARPPAGPDVADLIYSPAAGPGRGPGAGAGVWVQARAAVRAMADRLHSVMEFQSPLDPASEREINEAFAEVIGLIDMVAQRLDTHCDTEDLVTEFRDWLELYAEPEDDDDAENP